MNHTQIAKQLIGLAEQYLKRFEVGDIVRVISLGNSYFNELGLVAKVDEATSESDVTIIYVEFVEGEMQYPFYLEELVLVQESSVGVV